MTLVRAVDQAPVSTVVSKLMCTEMQGVVWQNEFRIVKYLSVVDKNSFRLQPSFLWGKYFLFLTHFLGILSVQFHCIRTKRNLLCCCSVCNHSKRCLLCCCFQFYFSPYRNNWLWICCEHYRIMFSKLSIQQKLFLLHQIRLSLFKKMSVQFR